MNAFQAIDIIIFQWSHQHVKISLVNGSEKTVDPINSVSGKEYSEDWKVTDKANILPLNKHSRTGEDDKWWDCVSLKTDWTNGMLDFALRGINTLSGERARDLVNSVCTDRRKISADSAFGAHTAPSPAHGKTHTEAWKRGILRSAICVQAEGNLSFWESFPQRWKRRRGKVCVRSSGSAPGAARALSASSLPPSSRLGFCFFPGDRDVELSSYEERKKKVYFLDLREAVHVKRIRFFPVFVHFSSQTLQLV